MAQSGCCDHVQHGDDMQPYAYYEEAQTAVSKQSACPCERSQRWTQGRGVVKEC